MRLWSALAVVVLVACGGKIATETTDGPTKTKTIVHDGDDHDVSKSSSGNPGPVTSSCTDLPIACDGTGCTLDGTPRMECQNKGRNTQCRCDGATILLSQTQIETRADAIWAWETFCGGTCRSSESSSSSSGGAGDCNGLEIGCGGSDGAWTCEVTHPHGVGLSCSGATRGGTRCHCYGSYLDAGTATFALPAAEPPELDELQTLWQTRCGGTCF